jgi:hypothetical protein
MAVVDHPSPSLVRVDFEDDGLTDAEREELHRTIERSLEQEHRGEVMTWEETLVWLETRRGKPRAP